MKLAEFRFFHHGHGNHTLWLSPEPKETLVQLETALLNVVPDCNDAIRHQGGFTPHLSVGQVSGQAAMESRCIGTKNTSSVMASNNIYRSRGQFDLAQ
jgi:hypothetical protein